MEMRQGSEVGISLRIDLGLGVRLGRNKNMGMSCLELS